MFKFCKRKNEFHFLSLPFPEKVCLFHPLPHSPLYSEWKPPFLFQTRIRCWLSCNGSYVRSPLQSGGITLRIRHVSFRIPCHEAAACDSSGTRGVIGRACRLLMEGENEAKRGMKRISFSLNALLYERNKASMELFRREFLICCKQMWEL